MCDGIKPLPDDITKQISAWKTEIRKEVSLLAKHAADLFIKVGELKHWKDEMENEMRARIAQFNSVVDRIRTIETVLQMPAPSLEIAVSRGKTHDPIVVTQPRGLLTPTEVREKRDNDARSPKSTEQLLERITHLKEVNNKLDSENDNLVRQLNQLKEENQHYESRINELIVSNNEAFQKMNALRQFVEETIFDPQ